MPWKETSAMDLRVRFVADCMKGIDSKSSLCAFYGISRPTGDKWIARYHAGGWDGLKERSRAPLSYPYAVTEAVRAKIVEVKLSHQDWGPRKVVDLLRRDYKGQVWPADSTVGEILKRTGLVRSRRRRRHAPPDTQPFGACERCNDSVSADFKGPGRLSNGRRYYPLTISDNFSRYVLLCRALIHPTYEAVRPWFEWVFREYGLPLVIRTDNGPPFASLAVGGLSALSLWWIRLGIRPERIRPGRPDQNGRHERMHRTLKAAAMRTVHKTLATQQHRFDHFVHEFNCERSHEALHRQTPAEVYHPSPRSYPAKLPMVEYDSGTVIRHVRHNGEIKWHGRTIYLSKVLAHEPVALEQVDNHRWEVRYSFHPLGLLDEKTDTIVPHKEWHEKTQTCKLCPRSKT